MSKTNEELTDLLEQHQAVIGILLGMLEAQGALSHQELNSYLKKIREQWPTALDGKANLFDFLLENRPDPNDPGDPDKPNWFRGVIPGGRVDEQ